MSLRWFSTAAQVAGASLLAVRIGPPAFAYVVMTFGALGWMELAKRDRDRALYALNVAFLVLNLAGIVRWFFA